MAISFQFSSDFCHCRRVKLAVVVVTLLLLLQSTLSDAATNSSLSNPCALPVCSNFYYNPGELIPCPNNCSLYLECYLQESWGWTVRSCAPGTYFDANARWCLQAALATCHPPCASNESTPLECTTPSTDWSTTESSVVIETTQTSSSEVGGSGSHHQTVNTTPESSLVSLTTRTSSNAVDGSGTHHQFISTTSVGAVTNSSLSNPCDLPVCSNVYYNPGEKIPCPNNCSLYLECYLQDSWGWIARSCSPGTHFDAHARECQHASLATCHPSCASNESTPLECTIPSTDWSTTESSLVGLTTRTSSNAIDGSGTHHQFISTTSESSVVSLTTRVSSNAVDGSDTTSVPPGQSSTHHQNTDLTTMTSTTPSSIINITTSRTSTSNGVIFSTNVASASSSTTVRNGNSGEPVSSTVSITLDGISAVASSFTTANSIWTSAPATGADDSSTFTSSFFITMSEMTRTSNIVVGGSDATTAVLGQWSTDHHRADSTTASSTTPDGITTLLETTSSRPTTPDTIITTPLGTTSNRGFISTTLGISETPIGSTITSGHTALTPATTSVDDSSMSKSSFSISSGSNSSRLASDPSRTTMIMTTIISVTTDTTPATTVTLPMMSTSTPVTPVPSTTTMSGSSGATSTTTSATSSYPSSLISTTVTESPTTFAFVLPPEDEDSIDIVLLLILILVIITLLVAIVIIIYICHTRKSVAPAPETIIYTNQSTSTSNLKQTSEVTTFPKFEPNDSEPVAEVHRPQEIKPFEVSFTGNELEEDTNPNWPNDRGPSPPIFPTVGYIDFEEEILVQRKVRVTLHNTGSPSNTGNDLLPDTWNGLSTVDNTNKLPHTQPCTLPANVATWDVTKLSTGSDRLRPVPVGLSPLALTTRPASQMALTQWNNQTGAEWPPSDDRRALLPPEGLDDNRKDQLMAYPTTKERLEQQQQEQQLALSSPQESAHTTTSHQERERKRRKKIMPAIPLAAASTTWELFDEESIEQRHLALPSPPERAQSASSHQERYDNGRRKIMPMPLAPSSLGDSNSTMALVHASQVHTCGDTRADQFERCSSTLALEDNDNYIATNRAAGLWSTVAAAIREENVMTSSSSTSDSRQINDDRMTRTAQSIANDDIDLDRRIALAVGRPRTEVEDGAQLARAAEAEQRTPESEQFVTRAVQSQSSQRRMAWSADDESTTQKLTRAEQSMRYLQQYGGGQALQSFTGPSMSGVPTEGDPNRQGHLTTYQTSYQQHSITSGRAGLSHLALPSTSEQLQSPTTYESDSREITPYRDGRMTTPTAAMTGAKSTADSDANDDRRVMLTVGRPPSGRAGSDQNAGTLERWPAAVHTAQASTIADRSVQFMHQQFGGGQQLQPFNGSLLVTESIQGASNRQDQHVTFQTPSFPHRALPPAS